MRGPPRLRRGGGAGGITPLPGTPAAIEGLRIAEAIVESARSGQTVTLMPR
ncbi:hypothetical protein [Synechococcus sp. CBW1107]|uniref:hypothetical protein n=1 Tax=Synechococcus sp. CBW1107 TaxID=2789857 RepID=UPI002AD53D43|nr:hypothetical protein [Synechococcus sp. CBW1107]